MALYFRLLVYLSMFFALASLAALPALLLNAGGQRLTQEDSDGLGLAKLSLGNLGPPKDKAFVVNDTLSNDDFVIEMAFFGTQYTLSEAAQVITYADFVYSVLFLLFALWWTRKLHATERSVDDENVTAADYAVYVRGLPRDATVGEVRAHFDALYNLRAPDWTWKGSCSRCYCGHKDTQRRQFRGPKAAARLERKWMEYNRARAARTRKGCCGGTVRVAPSAGGAAVARPAPVDWRDWFVSPTLNATNSSDPGYLRSWVAEVTLCYPNGALLRRYQALQGLRSRLLHARAAVKVYSDPRGWTPRQAGCCGVCCECEVDGSCAGGGCRCCLVRSGPLAARLAAAETHLQRIEVRLRRLDLRHASKLRDDVIGAFVVFNNEESYRRCLYDYDGTKAWWMDLCGRGPNHCCQPPPLRMRGRALVVGQAPEADDVIWENLQTPQWERSLRVACTNLLMLLLLAVSFVAILLSQQQQADLNLFLPELAICEQQAPAAAYGGIAAVPSDLPRLTRSKTMDSSCDSVPGASSGSLLYLWYEGSAAPPTPPLTAPLLANITNAADVVTSTVRNHCAGPCIPKSVTSDEPCVVPGQVDREGGTATFPVRNIIGCFCLGALQASIERDGVFSGAVDVLNKFPSCEKLASSYVLAQVLIGFAAAGIVIINTMLQGFLARVTHLEHHNSVSDLKNATAAKLFLALFLNTGLLVLLVHARIAGSDALPIGLFNGEFDSFSPGWYSVAGVSLSLTMVINIIAPHILPLGSYMCVVPCKRQCCGHTALVQHELNQLYSAPQFEIESRVPHVMNTVMVALVYSSGIPLLLPIAAVSLLVTFVIDKLLLLRFYARPPLLDSSMAQLAANIMPFAGLAHTAFAVWFYGDEDTVASTPLLLGDPGGVGAEQRYQDFVDSVSGWDVVGFAPRIVRQNTFPMFFLFVVLLLGILLRFTVGRLLWSLLGRLVHGASCGRWCDQHTAVDDNCNPPFTGEFERKVPLGVKMALSPADQALGWRVVDDHLRAPGAQAQVKVWPRSGSQFGKAHYKGDFMLTWEVIAEYGIASYDMAANPRYAAAVMALERGAAHAAAVRAREASAALKATVASVGRAKAAIDSMRGAVADSKRAAPPALQGMGTSPQRAARGGGGRALRPSGASAVDSGSRSARGQHEVAPPRQQVGSPRMGPLPSTGRGGGGFGVAAPAAAAPVSPRAVNPLTTGQPSRGLQRSSSFTRARGGGGSLLNDGGLEIPDPERELSGV